MLFLGICFCGLSGNHPKEDVEKIESHPQENLAKSGYKSDMKYKTFNKPSVFMASP